MSWRCRASYPCNFSFTVNIQSLSLSRRVEGERGQPERAAAFRARSLDTRGTSLEDKVPREPSSSLVSYFSSQNRYDGNSVFYKTYISVFFVGTLERLPVLQFAYLRRSYGSRWNFAGRCASVRIPDDRSSRTLCWKRKSWCLWKHGLSGGRIYRLKLIYRGNVEGVREIAGKVEFWNPWNERKFQIRCFSGVFIIYYVEFLRIDLCFWRQLVFVEFIIFSDSKLKHAELHLLEITNVVYFILHYMHNNFLLWICCVILNNSNKCSVLELFQMLSSRSWFQLRLQRAFAAINMSYRVDRSLGITRLSSTSSMEKLYFSSFSLLNCEYVSIIRSSSASETRMQVLNFIFNLVLSVSPNF